VRAPRSVANSKRSDLPGRVRRHREEPKARQFERLGELDDATRVVQVPRPLTFPVLELASLPLHLRECGSARLSDSRTRLPARRTTALRETEGESDAPSASTRNAARSDRPTRCSLRRGWDYHGRAAADVGLRIELTDSESYDLDRVRFSHRSEELVHRMKVWPVELPVYLVMHGYDPSGAEPVYLPPSCLGADRRRPADGDAQQVHGADVSDLVVG
jgi:hypothetical protein